MTTVGVAAKRGLTQRLIKQKEQKDEPITRNLGTYFEKTANG
jgi:hypothetical protein